MESKLNNLRKNLVQVTNVVKRIDIRYDNMITDYLEEARYLIDNIESDISSILDSIEPLTFENEDKEDDIHGYPSVEEAKKEVSEVSLEEQYSRWRHGS